MDDNLYYKATGKASVVSILTCLIGGLICTGILASVYIALQWFIPIIYFNFLITLGLAIGLIIVVNFLHRNGKVRNRLVAIVTMFFIALFAFYFQWALFVSLMMGSEGTMGNGTWVKSSFSYDYFLTYFLNPSLLWQDILLLNEYGTFSLKNSVVSGGFLWLVWAIEAIVIVGWPTFSMLAGDATKPFSETENSWMSKRILPDIFPYVEDKEKLADQLKKGDLSAIEQPIAEDETVDRFATAEVYELPGDPHQYLSIKNVTLKTNKKGEIERKEADVVEYFKLVAGTIA